MIHTYCLLLSTGSLLGMSGLATPLLPILPHHNGSDSRCFVLIYTRGGNPVPNGLNSLFGNRRED